jgi:hypothetical protein
MTPSKALNVVISGLFLDHVLWRDPMEPIYTLSAPGDDDHYEQQGWAQIATVGALYKHYKALNGDQGTPNPLLSLLVHDAERERRSAK